MAAKASKKQQGAKLQQASVKSVWCAYFLRRIALDRLRRAGKKKR